MLSFRVLKLGIAALGPVTKRRTGTLQPKQNDEPLVTAALGRSSCILTVGGQCNLLLGERRELRKRGGARESRAQSLLFYRRFSEGGSSAQTLRKSGNQCATTLHQPQSTKQNRRHLVSFCCMVTSASNAWVPCVCSGTLNSSFYVVTTVIIPCWNPVRYTCSLDGISSKLIRTLEVSLYSPPPFSSPLALSSSRVFLQSYLSRSKTIKDG